jgi:DNA-binding winged helix-turn-helix (wHTH) protein/Tol biopolymer transport system component
MEGNDAGVPPAGTPGESLPGKAKPGSNSVALLYQFDLYELHSQSYEIRRRGLRLRVPRSPMELLILLIERRQTVVSRKEIAARLWAEPNMVDVDQGINTAIRRIRELLRDDPSKPRFIETVVGTGYRFIAKVKEIEADVTAPPLTLVGEPEFSEASSRPAESTGAIQRQEVQIQALELKDAHRGWEVSAAIALSLVLLIGFIGFAGRQLYKKHKLSGYTASLVQITTNDSEQSVTAAAISPDGKWMAYGDINGISLRLLQSGKTIPLHGPENFRTERIAWFPDQTKVLISGFDTEIASPQIWTVFITGEAPQPFRKNARNGIPSPDGTRVVFTANEDREMWISGIDGESAHPLIVDRFSKAFSAIFWSGDGKRISYLRSRDVLGDENYESVDAGSGKLLALEKNVRFESACALADGRVFFLGGPKADLRNSRTLWEVNTDPLDGAFVSAPKRIATVDRARVVGLTISDQGDKLSAVMEKGQSHVFTGTMQKPGPRLVDVRRLTYDTRTDYPHSWLLDNHTVVFESDRSGTFRLYLQRLGDRTAREIETGTRPAVLPQVTPDGKWILYAIKPYVLPSVKDRLFRISVGGGISEEVAIGGPLDEFECPLLKGPGCVLREVQGKRIFVYYALDPITGKGREIARTSWMPHILGDWGVSPDGSAVALTSHDVANPRIRIVFLGGNSTRPQQELPVPGCGTLAGISWSADGKGWYITANTEFGTSLLSVNQHGESYVLRHTALSTWGVPSPDGNKLAFVDQAIDSNVWMWQIAGQP